MAHSDLPTSNRLMESALADEIFTAAVLIVAERGQTLLDHPYGTLGGSGTAETEAVTLFDLASLTKVLATAPCWMILHGERAGILDKPLARWFPRCPEDKQAITPRLLLSHTSGLPAWRPYYLFESACTDRRAFTREKILSEDLVHPPGDGCIYSDLGFILLGDILEIETGKSLDVLSTERIFEPIGISGDLMFRPEGHKQRIALTRRGEAPGLVNDLNCRAMGAVAGHAGLFGTAGAVAAVAREYLRGLASAGGFFDHATMKLFAEKVRSTPECTRSLGFDTPSVDGSTSGRFFSPRSLGHTGFTGTSLWMDPERDVVVVLLTNRVIMGESDFRIKTFRPALHDAVMADLGFSDRDTR